MPENIKIKIEKRKSIGRESFIKAEYFNGPNSLTLFRLLLIVPIYNLLILEKYISVACIAIVAWGLDFFDGYFARLTNEVTEFGAKFDPTVDKLLNLLLLNTVLYNTFYLSIFGYSTIYILTAIEGILLLIAWIIKPILNSYGFTKRIGANWFGKTKMVFESMAVFIAIIISAQWLLSINYFLNFLANGCILLAIIFGIGSIVGHLSYKK
jgi:phosphatidylglycerophosphate synthase